MKSSAWAFWSGNTAFKTRKDQVVLVARHKMTSRASNQSHSDIQINQDASNSVTAVSCLIRQHGWHFWKTGQYLTKQPERHGIKMIGAEDQ